MSGLFKSLLRNLGRGSRKATPARAPEQLLAEACVLFDAHDLAGARLRCEQVLEREPEQADALHLLGLTAHRLRDLNSATEYFERSIRARPGDAMFLNNLGSVLVDCGRTEEAAAVFRHALALAPGARPGWRPRGPGRPARRPARTPAFITAYGCFGLRA